MHAIRTLPALALAAALLAPAAWAAPFTVHADGTATDQATGLMWDRCALGQTGAACAGGSATGYAWAAALVAARTANTGNHKGRSDWRLPNANELESLVNIAGANPAIDTAAFPNAPSQSFWSSTNYEAYTTTSWMVSFAEGRVGHALKSTALPVRLVRSGQPVANFDALGDITAPTTTAGPSVVPGTNGTTASASVTVSEAATGYWQVLPAGSPAPTAAALLAQGPAQQVATAANAATSIALSGLTRGTAYVFYFTARDTSGNAQASVGSAAFTTANMPDAPTAVVATAGAVGSGRVTVTWAAPADNGSAITGYIVIGAPGAPVACTSPCVLTGLPNAASFSFTVRAINGAGTGAASSPPASATLQGLQSVFFGGQIPPQRAFAAGGSFAISPLAVATSGLPVTYVSSTPGVCTVSGTTVSMTGAGVCNIVASQVGNAHYVAATPVTQSVVIRPGVNSITFGAQGNQTYTTGGSFAISPLANATSGLPVAYSSTTPGVCTVSGSTVGIVAAGTCTIAANQGGNALWGAAAQVTQSLSIQKGVNTIQFGAQGGKTFVVGGTFTANPPATASSGLAVIYTSTTPTVCTVAGTTVVMVNAGTCTLAANQAGDGNWNAATQVTQNVVIGRGANPITFPPQPGQTFTSGGSFAIQPPATAASNLPVTYSSTTQAVCTVSGATVSMLAAGTCTLAANQAGDSNWAAATQVTQNVVIGKATNTISFPAQAGQTFTSGGRFAIAPLATASSNLPVTYSSTTPAVCTVAGTTVTVVSAGTCTVAADQAGDANWAAAAQALQNVAIGKGSNPIAFPAQAARVYVSGGTFAISPVATAASGLAVSYSSLATAVCTVTGSTVTIVSAGTCTVAADQAGDANWAPATQATQVVVIGQAANTITFADPGVQAVGAPLTLSASATSGLAVLFSASGDCTLSGNTVGFANPGTCTVTASQAGDANWAAATDVSHTFAVAQRSRSVAVPGGMATASFNGGGAACSFESLAAATPATSGPAQPPANLVFVHGLLDFVLSGCDQSDVQMTVTYPQALAQGTAYWKLRAGTWAPYPAQVDEAAGTAVFNLRDGGAGDDDGVANGRIVDPSGAAHLAAATPVPTLGQWVLMLLGLCLGATGMRRLRRS